MGQGNVAEAGFLVLRQGDFLADGGCFPGQLEGRGSYRVIYGNVHWNFLRLVGIETLP